MGSGSRSLPAPGEAQDRFPRLGGLLTPRGADGKSSALGVEHPVQCCVAMVGDPCAGALSLKPGTSVAASLSLSAGCGRCCWFKSGLT